MSLQFGANSRNGMLDSLETTIGAGPTLELRTGAPPANCAAADTGTLLASMVLPADWMSAAGSGNKAKLGTWEDLSANNAGDPDPGHFRIKTSGGTCEVQGTLTETGGGGDMTVNAASVTAGQKITVTGFTLTAPGA